MRQRRLAPLVALLRREWPPFLVLAALPVVLQVAPKGPADLVGIVDWRRRSAGRRWMAVSRRSSPTPRGAMVWRADFAPGAERDFAIILDHRTEACIALGDAPAAAVGRAIERVREIKAQAERLGHAPGVGAARGDIGEGLRHVAFDRAIDWFAADAEARAVTVLAVFLAGQDRHRKMASRLAFTGSSTERVETPWTQASSLTATSALAAVRRGARKLGK